MDSEELQKIRECLTWQEGQPEIPVSAAASLGLALLAEVERLREENAALRARAVPEVVWYGLRAESGRFVLEVRNAPHGWMCEIWKNGRVVHSSGMSGGTEELAKFYCEKSFLRLVGVRE